MRLKNYKVVQLNGRVDQFASVYIEVEDGILYIVEPGKQIVAVFNVGEWTRVQEVG